MLHGAQSPTTSAAGPGLDQQQEPGKLPVKRKADSQDNERLSKRLSLLNIEQSGSKLYVPVETPSASTPSSSNNAAVNPPGKGLVPDDDDTMQVDDSKHKVYIYNIDDELSDDSEPDEAKLVFLPDIEKHLRASRIPPSILANDDGEAAGMEVVLYSDPKSISVPENKDSVRKAILESRRRTREQQRREREGKDSTASSASPAADADIPGGESTPVNTSPDDPDAMEMD